MNEVSLRAVTEADLSMLERFLSDPEAVGPFEWLGYMDSSRFRREWSENRLLGPDAGVLLPVRGNDPLGMVSWRKVTTSRSSYCWNIGIALLPDSRGQGFGTRAQRLLVEYLFDHTQVARIEACTDAGNHAEQRSLEKAGFTREGVLRGYYFRAGRWHDSVLYSVVRDDL